VAVITGGASGIGFAPAERLAAEAMKIVVADIESGALEAAVKKLESAGAAVLAVRTDAGDPGARPAQRDRARARPHARGSEASRGERE
jgi:NAD(P)-dependent dehydrogenase (short-subunit alcohol dehydrogenase family)